MRGIKFDKGWELRLGKRKTPEKGSGEGDILTWDLIRYKMLFLSLMKIKKNKKLYGQFCKYNYFLFNSYFATRLV